MRGTLRKLRGSRGEYAFFLHGTNALALTFAGRGCKLQTIQDFGAVVASHVVAPHQRRSGKSCSGICTCTHLMKSQSSHTLRSQTTGGVKEATTSYSDRRRLTNLRWDANFSEILHFLASTNYRLSSNNGIRSPWNGSRDDQSRLQCDLHHFRKAIPRRW